jgi:hypothetical protein
MARLAFLLRALRCQDCKQRPQRVVLVDNPAERVDSAGAPGRWHIAMMLPAPGFGSTNREA